MSERVTTLRSEGRTRAAGLLFLFNILRDADIPNEIAESDLAPARPFRWILHQFGLSLASARPRDPAALAFAGLPPRAQPPQGDPISPAEQAAIQVWVSRVASELRDRLPDANQDDRTLLDRVCLRPARIVADPGWFQVHLSASTISTPIRRAGLDLDPGVVPWLGIVVRFVYE